MKKAIRARFKMILMSLGFLCRFLYSVQMFGYSKDALSKDVLEEDKNLVSGKYHVSHIT